MLRHHMLISVILMAILFFLAIPVLAEMIVDTAWVRRYNGPGNDYDYASAMVVDDSGNVYVTGYSYGSGTGFDYATIKYYPNGDTAWVRRFIAPYSVDKAFAIAVDDSGNVYVTGYSHGGTTVYDYATIKYYPNGDIAWVRKYNGPGNGYDYALAIAVDSSGNVYVTGYSYGRGTWNDYATVKYNPDGDIAWVRRYNGSGNNYDRASAIAVDGYSNVYVTGYSYGSGTDFDYATIKYYSNGDTAWVKRYNGPGNSYDYALDITVDGFGNVYVTGESYFGYSSNDYATIKYYPNGKTAWVRRYSGPGNNDDYAYAIAVDSSGNVYVTGYSYGSGTDLDYATIKYYSDGDTAWVRRYNGPGNSYDYALDIAVDGYGNVYVTGHSYGSGAGFDYATIKYDSLGNELWEEIYNGPANGDDIAYVIALKGCGEVYVTGKSLGSDSDYDYTTIKYVDTGRLRGDVNADGVIDAGDVVYLVSYLYRDGLPPDPLVVGDCNSDGIINVGDIVYLVSYLYRGGPPPGCP